MSLRICFGLFVLAVAGAAQAADPAEGTLTLDSGPLTYTAGPVFVPNPSSQVGSNTCFDSQFTCDVFTLTTDLPDNYDKTHPFGLVSVSVGWANRLLDFEVFVTDENGKIVAGLSSSNNPELMVFPPPPGKHVFQVTTFPNIADGDVINGTVTLFDTTGPSSQDGPTLDFADHKPPEGVATDAGEPSIGFNPMTGKVFFEAGLETDRVTLDDANPGQSTWEDVSSPFSATSLDPIMFVDQGKGRVFVSQLFGITSLLSFSDDDGMTWTPSEGAGIPAGVDHQTVGAGPYPEAFSFLSDNPLYGNAVYYCSQDIFTALCSRSDDGGITFASPVPIYGPECGGIHGHVKVAPDGTVYVPTKSCADGDKSFDSVAVSEDAGLSWTVHTVPTAPAGQGSDPSVGIATDGTVYFAYQGFDGHAHAVVTHDKGQTWENDTDISGPINVQNIVFPATVAGDPDRAAVAFIGTETRGTPGDGEFPGEWFLYIASTFDGGANWRTVNATPGNPVQRAGGICLGGITCSGDNRNLLDFIDATVDDQGRILVAYADGCTGDCDQGPPNSFTAVGSVVRQTEGPRLFAAPASTNPPGDTGGGGGGSSSGGGGSGGLDLGLLAGLLAFGALRRRIIETATQRSLAASIESGYPHRTAGCHHVLDRVLGWRNSPLRVTTQRRKVMKHSVFSTLLIGAALMVTSAGFAADQSSASSTAAQSSAENTSTSTPASTGFICAENIPCSTVFGAVCSLFPKLTICHAT